MAVGWGGSVRNGVGLVCVPTAMKISSAHVLEHRGSFALLIVLLAVSHN